MKEATEFWVDMDPTLTPLSSWRPSLSTHSASTLSSHTLIPCICLKKCLIVVKNHIV